MLFARRIMPVMAAILATAPLGSCASAQEQRVTVGAADQQGLQTTPPAYAYGLAGGDKIRVVVFGNPNLGGDFSIGGSGFS